MRLEEAIIHAEYVAESNEDMANVYHTDEGVYLREESKCRKCAEEHRQLAEWLVELKERRAKDETQTELAKKTHISPSMISCYETDRYEPRFSAFESIIHALNYRIAIQPQENSIKELDKQ